MSAKLDFVWIQPLTTFNHVRRRIDECRDLDNLHKIECSVMRLYQNSCLTLTHYLALDEILCHRKIVLCDERGIKRR